ncbi:hypothetical protein C8T65DRAFT_739798 [Cerioporus squamosus]|nr:hypothetical protein C8T65DRAFT_739798 [Cerioporus squamosus]
MSPPAHCSTSAVLLPAYCTCSPRCRSPQPLPSGSQGVQTGGGLHPHVPDACGAPPSEHSTCGYTDAWSAEFAVCLGPESLVELPPPADGTRSAAAPACGFSHELEFAVCLGPESLVGLPPPADGTRSAAAPACGFSHELEVIFSALTTARHLC